MTLAGQEDSTESVDSASSDGSALSKRPPRCRFGDRLSLNKFRRSLRKRRLGGNR